MHKVLEMFSRACCRQYILENLERSWCEENCGNNRQHAGQHERKRVKFIPKNDGANDQAAGGKPRSMGNQNIFAAAVLNRWLMRSLSVKGKITAHNYGTGIGAKN